MNVGKRGPSDPREGRRSRVERVTGRTDGKDFEPTNRLNRFSVTGEGQPSSAPAGLVSLLVILTALAARILTNRMSELLTSGTVGRTVG